MSVPFNQIINATTVVKSVVIPPTAKRRPNPYDIILPVKEGVPELLKQLKRWIVWRAEQKRDTKTGELLYKPNGKPKLDKLPIGAISKQPGIQTTPEHWTDFDTAWKAYEKDLTLSGIGFCSAGGNDIAIDIDNCIDDHGNYSTKGKEALDLFGDSYAEISPSGDGIRIFVLGDQITNISKPIEVYQQLGRYVTVTGKRISKGNDVIRVEAFGPWYAQLVASRKSESEAVGAAQAVPFVLTQEVDLGRLTKQTLALIRGADEAWAKYDNDGSTVVFNVCKDMFRAGYNRKQVFNVCMDSQYALFEVASRHNQTRVGQIRWLMTYNIKKAEAVVAGESLLGLANLDDGVKETDAEAIERLSWLPAFDFDRCFKKEAEKLGIKASTLETTVKKERESRGESTETGNGSPLVFPDIELWPDEVNGAELLNDMVDIIKRHVILPDEAAIAAALWAIHTYAYDLGRVTPILAIYSPQPRCGKSTLLALLTKMASKSIPASNISPSAVFRVIEKCSPTLLLDEADSFMKDNEELRGILNSGHTRDSAFVVRNVTVGTNYDPRTFSTWAPKAIALIGRLPTTLHDRSIVVELERKLPFEKVERIPKRDFSLMDIQQRCTRFVSDNSVAISESSSLEVVGLHDRASDNWEPLFALADIAGDDWPEKSRKAALVLAEGTEDDSYTATLLTDIRNYFKENPKVTEVWSSTLVDHLVELEERPWADFRHGKRLSMNQLARLLAPFKLITKTIHGKDAFSKPTKLKGYTRKSFDRVFRRYLPEDFLYLI